MSDNPPFGFIENIIDPWYGPVILPTLNVKSPLRGVEVDNPPFGFIENIIDPWVGPPPNPTLSGKLNPSLLLFQRDNPPFTHWGRTAIETEAVLIGWIPPPPLPTLTSKCNPSALNVPFNNPPFGFIENIIDPWLDPAPLPTLPKLNAPGLPGTSVDNPPGSVPAGLMAIADPWALQLPTLGTKIAAVIGAVAPPSPYISQQVNIVQNWQIQDGLPITNKKLSPSIIAVEVDNPPFSERNNFSGIIVAWLDPPPNPTLSTKSVFSVEVDNPPFTHLGRTASINEIISGIWQPPDPSPTLSNKLSPVLLAVAPIAPPLQGVNTLSSVIFDSWFFPEPPLPTLNVKSSRLGVRVDNPPFGFIEATSDFWADEFRLPPFGNKIVQGAVVVSQATPPASVNASVIISAWQAHDPLPTLPKLNAPGLPGQSVDNPPGSVPSNFIAISYPWVPQLPTKLSPSILTAPGNNPPFSERDNLSSVILQWFFPDPTPTLNTKSPRVGVRVDNPPFGFIENIIDPWLDPPPNPTLSTKSVFSVEVDNPPFGLPELNLIETVLDYWVDEYRQPTLPPKLVQPAAPSTGTATDNIMKRIAFNPIRGIMRGIFEAQPLNWDDQLDS